LVEEFCRAHGGHSQKQGFQKPSLKSNPTPTKRRKTNTECEAQSVAMDCASKQFKDGGKLKNGGKMGF
jgi:hypothetical protein